MSTRQHIKAAWDDAIRLYLAGRINSERTLQAVLYASFVAKLPTDSYVLCEPRIEDLEKFEAVIPDILITQGNYVVAAIELKFEPHHYPLFHGDLEKLIAYGDAKHSFKLLLDSATGKYSQHSFSFSPECLLVFGVFGQSDSDAVDVATLQRRKRGLAWLGFAANPAPNSDP